jgi:putative transposase
MFLIALLGRWGFARRATLIAEILTLRQQLAALHRTAPRPRLRIWERVFWVLVSRWFADWKQWLVIVKPETVIQWHRQGFRLYWRWKSRGRPGRPTIPRKLQALIRRIAAENPLWGVPRIQSELRLLGHDLAESTVAKYVPKPRKPPSQTWRTFLKNHANSLAAIDFFTVPTVMFRNLYVFLVLRHDRRRIVHFAVTEQPHAAWVAQQLREAFPFEEGPKYLIRDKDGVYGAETSQCLKSLGIEEVRITPRSRWQNAFVERLIGTFRRELLDHVIVLNESHLEKLIAEFLVYYQESRPHSSLADNFPVPRDIDPPQNGDAVSIPMVGGLHHRYRRAG